MSGISGHLAIHLKQDGKLYTCLCPHADDASSTCRGDCADPRSAGLQSMCYAGGLEMDGNSSLSEKSKSQRVSRAVNVHRCRCVPAHGADFMHACSTACPKHDGLLHRQPDFVLSFDFWASQPSPVYSVPPPLSAWGNSNLGIHISF